MSGAYRGRGFGRGRFQSWKRGRGGGSFSGSWREREDRADQSKATGKHTSEQTSQPLRLQSTLDQFIPYKGWKLYFSEVYSDSSPFIEKIQAFEKFFTRHIDLYDKDEIERKGSILVDFKELTKDDEIINLIPDIENALRDTPEKTLACMGLAIHQVLTKDLERHAAELQAQEGLSNDGETMVNVPHIFARVYNYEPLTHLKSIRANCYGKYISVRGTVVRVGNIKPLCTKMAFRCAACGEIQSFPLPDGKYNLPTKCPVPACRGKSFAPLRSSPLTVTVDWQLIKVQELMSDAQREAGRIPRTIECELVHDLVDSCVPGDTVTITGIVKVSNTEEGSRNKNDKCMFLLYIESNSVSNSKGQKSQTAEDGSQHGTLMEFSLKDLYAIQEIQAEENLLKLIVNSLCPVIFGHELVKAGLTLALFGGSQKYTDDKNRIPIRGDPHILIVGDPGLGKSQMLQAACNVAPRGVYVCGNTTTSSGLTVTLSKDSSSGDFALEAGALVLGDQGICGIDEFDKMGNQHQALLEAMEQQSISLAKAGVVCSLPARTSIIAAANPVGGHYNKAKTVSENLKMGSALLSRFDLVFILLDTPNEQHDHLLSEHVIAVRAGKQKTISSAAVAWTLSQDSNTSVLEVVSEKPLSERLKVAPGEKIDPIPHQLLRKYVGYARQYVHPRLSIEAAQALQDFYLELRKQSQRMSSSPITTRQLESLIRLTEARARLELREEATKEDAEDIIEIMKHSMLGTYSDEFGNLDFERSQHGSGMSNRSTAKRFISALNSIAERTYNNIFQYHQLRQIAKELNIQCPVPACRGKSFAPLRSSPLTVTVDWQLIKIQELMSDAQREAGRIPRTIECELVHDLVDSCVPGDTVTITGIVKVSNTEEGSRNKNDKCMFLLYIESNSVSNSKGQKSQTAEDGSQHGTLMEFSLKDLYAIQEIQAEENLLKLIVNSLCPVIFGHELVKAGLTLALFGGSQKYTDDKNRIPIRGDPHILIVGDPGLGKSQMLQAACNVAPRGVYVCGNTTTSSGLTVTLSKDSSSGDFALEAGALVLGDQGICGIDEFDKMGNQHQALLEAMEQQSISLAKAGVVCSLPARTSIIAAANPVGGHYNKAKTVSENLKMGSALLSRFDLVFILLDTPNEQHDHLLSEHVIAVRAGKQKTISSAAVARTLSQDSNTSVLEVVSEKPLSERLKVAPGEKIDPIPHQLLRKYVGYARQYVHPRLSIEAAQALQDFYLELRKQSQRMSSSPITTRQLESLIRLTEARARLELREEATKEDAEDIIEIMKHSMLGTYSDEFGNLDFERSQHGSGMSNRSTAKRFISALNSIAERTYNNIFQYHQLRQIAKELNIQVAVFENFIGSLNDQGYLLKKGPKIYQLQTM